MIRRFAENPVLSPADVPASRPDFEVLCAFNPGAVLHKDQVLLFVRVAERPIPEKGYVATAIMNPENPGQLEIIRVRLDDPDLQMDDPRVFSYKGKNYLTSISHLRLAFSKDGRNFTVAEKPAMFSAMPYEEYGIEDPRITFLDGTYYINYSAISKQGIVTCLAKTCDFETYERMGIVFAPHNKDMAIFPQRVNNRYVCFHRPLSPQFGMPSLWLAFSSNLTDWGGHRHLLAPRRGHWDSERIGCGPAPLKTSRGWLEIYHASDHDVRYCLGAVLLDFDDPFRVIARSREPIMIPSEKYECFGFLGGVVFCNGLVEHEDGRVDIYYGAADQFTCGASFDVDACLETLEEI